VSIPQACPYCAVRNPKWVCAKAKCCDSCEDRRDGDPDPETEADAMARLMQLRLKAESLRARVARLEGR
jgi:hypothetical protein